MLVPDLVRLRILRAHDLTLGAKKKKLKCKVYGASKTIYSQSAENNGPNCLWDSEITIKMNSPSEDVKIVISDDKNNHYGQVLITKHEILARKEGTTSDSMLEMNLEPTSKNKNVSGRIYFWIWAATLREEDSLGQAESHNSISSVGSKIKTDIGSNFSLNKLKIDIKKPKNKLKSLGSHVRSNLDLSSNLSKKSFDTGSIQELNNSVAPQTPLTPSSNNEEDSFTFEKELPKVSRASFEMGEIHEDDYEIDNSTVSTSRLTHKGSSLSNDPTRRPKIVGIEPIYGPTTGNFNVDIIFENLEEVDLDGAILLIGDNLHKDWKYNKNKDSKRNTVSVNFPKSIRENVTWDCKIDFDFIKFGTISCPKLFKYQAVEEKRTPPKLITSKNSLRRIREYEAEPKSEATPKKDSDLDSTLNSLAQSLDKENNFDMTPIKIERVYDIKSAIPNIKPEPYSTNSSLDVKSLEKDLKTDSPVDDYSNRDELSSRRNTEIENTESEKEDSIDDERTESESRGNESDEKEEPENNFNKRAQAFSFPAKAPQINKISQNRTNIFSSFEKDFIENNKDKIEEKSSTTLYAKREPLKETFKKNSSEEIKPLTEPVVNSAIDDALKQLLVNIPDSSPSANRTKKSNDLVKRVDNSPIDRSPNVVVKTDRLVLNDKRLTRNPSPLEKNVVIPQIKVENFGSLPRELSQDSNKMDFYEPKKPINQVVPTKIDKSIKKDEHESDDIKKPKLSQDGRTKKESEVDVKVENVVDKLRKENKMLKETINSLNADVDRISLDLCKLRIRILENGPIELLEKQWN